MHDAIDETWSFGRRRASGSGARRSVRGIVDVPRPEARRGPARPARVRLAVRGAPLPRGAAADHDGRARALRHAGRVGGRRRASRPSRGRLAWRASLARLGRDRMARAAAAVGRRAVRLGGRCARRIAAAALKFALRSLSRRPRVLRGAFASPARARRAVGCSWPSRPGASLSAVTGVVDGFVPGSAPAWRLFHEGTFDALGLTRASGVFEYPTIGAMYWEACVPLLVAAPFVWRKRAATARAAHSRRRGQRSPPRWPSSPARRAPRSWERPSLARSGRPRAAGPSARAPGRRRELLVLLVGCRPWASGPARPTRRSASAFGGGTTTGGSARSTTCPTRATVDGGADVRAFPSPCGTPGRSRGERRATLPDAPLLPLGARARQAARRPVRRSTRAGAPTCRWTCLPEASSRSSAVVQAPRGRGDVPPVVGPRAGERHLVQRARQRRRRAGRRRRGARNATPAPRDRGLEAGPAPGLRAPSLWRAAVALWRGAPAAGRRARTTSGAGTRRALSVADAASPTRTRASTPTASTSRRSRTSASRGSWRSRRWPRALCALLVQSRGVGLPRRARVRGGGGRLLRSRPARLLLRVHAAVWSVLGDARADGSVRARAPRGPSTPRQHAREGDLGENRRERRARARPLRDQDDVERRP